jgi:phospholipid/cholesterol/gamma-HCH transport system substrate-binding protein
MNEPTRFTRTEPHEGDEGGRQIEAGFRFRHVHAITGTFVILVALMLIAAVVWTGRSQRWFRSNVTLSIVLPEEGAAGIRQGSEVYFLGTRVGTVFDVIVDTTGRMEAQANIRRDFFLFVRADSWAVVKRRFGVAGDAYFEITRGHGQPLPEKNASIDCRVLPGTVENALEEVRSVALPVFEKLSAGLETWSTLGTNLITSQGRLEQLLARLNDMVEGVEHGKGTAGQLITDTSLADEAQQLLARANEAMSELRDVVTNLNVAVENVRHGTTHLPEIAGVVASEANDLPGLVDQTQVSMRELERLIEAMQRHWLLRKYVNQTDPSPLRPSFPGAEPQTKPVQSLRSPRDAGR